MDKHLTSITVSKSTDFSKWYRQIILKAKLIAYYDISGCYILLPNSYAIWENIKNYLDGQFKKRGVSNVYFPLLVTKNNLKKEETHIKEFTPEVAWITKVGNTKIEDENDYLAIRPTSECAIYPTISNLIRTHNDLPLKFNQWCNVIRWEFNDPTPFIRSREFLWNEGHTCYADKESAMEEVVDIIDLYYQTYKRLLAVPTIKGIKTDKEKFAGAECTYTLEGFIGEAGKGIQCATAHCLGQNFSKMFNIKFQSNDMTTKYVWQNSWGFTTRSIGVMLMCHGDDKGPILTPSIAPIQIVIIPIIFKKTRDIVIGYAENIAKKLSNQFRVHIDMRDYTPGWKHNHWEVVGTPLRIEIGPRDVKNNTFVACRRDICEKSVISVSDADDDLYTAEIYAIIININNSLYNNAHEKLVNSIAKPDNWNDFIDSVNNLKLCLIQWCNKTDCELEIKEKTGAKSLCIPTDEEFQLTITNQSICVHCGNPAVNSCLFGKSF